MPPLWLTAVAWSALAIAFASAGWIAFDMFVRGHRQRMWIMEVVWPITALYFGLVAVWAYLRWGRPNSPRVQEETGAEADYGLPASVAVGVSHCGAGCTLGDIAGAWIVFLVAWDLFGLALPAEYIADFALAFTLGIAFQYYSIAPMRGLGVREGIKAAVKADTLSLVAFELGLFGWMALMQFVLFPQPHLKPDHVAYWFLMQVGMIIGFATSYPANVWLIRRGVKEAM